MPNNNNQRKIEIKGRTNSYGRYSASTRRVSSRPRDDGLLGASFGEFMRCMAWNNFCYKPKGVFSNFLDNPHGN